MKMTLTIAEKAIYFQKLSKADLILALVANFMIMLVNIALNIILCSAILKLKFLRKVTYHFILSLAVSDLCIGIFVHGMITAILTCVLAGNVAGIHQLLLFHQAICVCFGQSSGLMLLMVAFDRYLHMKHLNFYNAYMTKRKSSFFILGSAIISLAAGIAFMFGSLGSAIFQILIGLTLTYYFMLVLAIILYIKIFLDFRSHNENTRLSNCHNSEVKLFKGIFAIMLSFLVCYLPFLSFNAYFYYSHESGNITEDLGTKLFLANILLFEIMLTESSINSIILFSCNGKLKRYFFSLFWKNSVAIEVQANHNY